MDQRGGRKGINWGFCLVGFCLISTSLIALALWRDKTHVLVENGAFATFLSDDAYLLGARVLQQSLRSSGSRYPLVVLVTEDVSSAARALLHAEDCLILPIEVVQNPNSEEVRYKWVYSKLRAWQMTRYDRIVFLDSDIVVKDNIDDLFSSSLPSFAAVRDCW